MTAVLLVEDDLVACKTITEWLQAAGLEIDFANSGEEALEILRQRSFDVLVLDWELPGISGFEILTSFRRSGGKTPVIFLTGRSSILDKLAVFDLGADDYLVKPCNPQELVVRIRAKAKRASSMVPSIIELGVVKLDTTVGTVVINSKKVRLSKTEYLVLEHLMRHQDRVFSAKDLLDSVWLSDSDATENSVRQLVYSLRQKLEKEGVATLLRKLPGGGYTVDSSYTQG